MTNFNNIIVACWLAFLVVWIISAFGMKRETTSSNWAGAAGFRLLAVIIIILILHFAPASFSQFFASSISHNLLIQILGLVLCILGIGFAFWARWHLGRNWSPHPALKVDHELVTSGPYRFVRHPIYTGIILAAIGSCLVSNGWLVVLLVGCIIFLTRFRTEENMMLKQFPDQYPEYRKRTKALIPFIW